MKPSFWSLKKNKLNNTKWFQAGYNIEFDISPYHDEMNKMNPHKP
jgi:hypothetical protein